MYWKISIAVLMLIFLQTGAEEILAQNLLSTEQPPQPPGAELPWNSPLVIVQCVWMVLVTIGAASYSYFVSKKNNGSGVVNEKELRGLNLPRGSLRGILALATIGSFVNVMVLGAPVLGDKFESVLAAFGTLTGSIVGFYFGTRGATSPPDSN